MAHHIPELERTMPWWRPYVEIFLTGLEVEPYGLRVVAIMQGEKVSLLDEDGFVSVDEASEYVKETLASLQAYLETKALRGRAAEFYGMLVEANDIKTEAEFIDFAKAMVNVLTLAIIDIRVIGGKQ